MKSILQAIREVKITDLVRGDIFHFIGQDEYEYKVISRTDKRYILLDLQDTAFRYCLNDSSSIVYPIRKEAVSDSEVTLASRKLYEWSRYDQEHEINP